MLLKGYQKSELEFRGKLILMITGFLLLKKLLTISFVSNNDNVEIRSN